MTRRTLFTTVASFAGVCCCPAFTARWKQIRQRRELDALVTCGQARLRARLQAEGLDLDRMSEGEVMDYIDRVIHDYRQEQRHQQST